jgi:hypothetical protein
LELDSIRWAVKRARAKCEEYERAGKTVKTDICDMIPYTNIHELVESLLGSAETMSE